MELQRRGERGAQNKKAEGTQDSTGRLPLSSTQWVPFFLFDCYKRKLKKSLIVP